MKLENKHREIIEKELDSIPCAIGRIIVTLEFCCGTGGTVNAMKVKKFTEQDYKL